MIDHEGNDYIYNDNLSPELSINKIRLYASKNGRYIGILRKNGYLLSTFEMYRVDKFNKVGM